MSIDLPAHLQAHLAELRSDLRFQEIMRALWDQKHTRIVPFTRNADRDKALTDLIWLSGRLAGEKSIMLEVLGYDPTDRTTE